MSNLEQRLRTLSPATLNAMRRGIEKESLRANADGRLAVTPHPAGLGAALTHPCITTDFCESQPELINGVHASAPKDLRRRYPVELEHFGPRYAEQQSLFTAA